VLLPYLAIYATGSDSNSCWSWVQLLGGGPTLLRGVPALLRAGSTLLGAQRQPQASLN
jgi:hypothetical protein